VGSVRTASLASNAYLHTVAPMAGAAPPAILPRRVDGPAHRHGLRTHSTPIRYPHLLLVAAAGTPAPGQAAPLTRL
jgi:hypothetical protein